MKIQVVPASGNRSLLVGPAILAAVAVVYLLLVDEVLLAVLPILGFALFDLVIANFFDPINK